MSGGGGDLFRQVNITMYDIQKSKSQSGLKFSEENEMKRALSKTDVSNEESPKQEQKKDLLGAVKEKVTTGINKVKDNLTLKKKLWA